MLSFIDASIILLTVVFACVLPYLNTTTACRTLARFFVCVLVIALCVYLPHVIGVPLSLLLVLSSVPVLNIGESQDNTSVQTNQTPHTHKQTTTTHRPIEQWIEQFKNPTDDDNQNTIEPFSLAKMNEKAIQDKLSVYEKVRTKQHAFEKQMEKINKNLKNVKEFYTNYAKQHKQASK